MVAMAKHGGRARGAARDGEDAHRVGPREPHAHRRPRAPPRRRGVQALTVHCRTAQMGHDGPADWDWARKAREVVSIPVVVNGDVKQRRRRAPRPRRDGLRGGDGGPPGHRAPVDLPRGPQPARHGRRGAAAHGAESGSTCAARTSAPTWRPRRASRRPGARVGTSRATSRASPGAALLRQRARHGTHNEARRTASEQSRWEDGPPPRPSPRGRALEATRRDRRHAPGLYPAHLARSPRATRAVPSRSTARRRVIHGGVARKRALRRPVLAPAPHAAPPALGRRWPSPTRASCARRGAATLLRGARHELLGAPLRARGRHFVPHFEQRSVTRFDDQQGAPPGRARGLRGRRPRAAGALGFDAGEPAPPRSGLDALRTTKTGLRAGVPRGGQPPRGAGSRRGPARRLPRGADDVELDLHLAYLRATRQDDPETPYKNIVALGATRRRCTT
jgi:hypothetical protein